MTFKLLCVTLKWKRTTCIFVAAVILILLIRVFYQLVFGQNNIITTFIRGTSKNSSSTKATKLSQTDAFESTYNLYDYRTKTIKETVLKQLSEDLRLIMAQHLPSEEMKVPETCSEETVGNSCKNGVCLQLQLPKDPQLRLEQLIRPDYLHPNAKYVNIMHDMGNAIPGFYDIILITGASSDHYLESKKHLYNIHANVLPHLTNFTIIYYNLGLSVKQKKDISSMCRCHMLDFPFDKFPKFFSLLKCYTWKPIVINAHAPHCNVIHWMDSSIRYFNDPSILRELLRRVRVHGVVDLLGESKLPHVTFIEMFHFFGDEACVYLWYMNAGGGFIMLLNKPLIKWGIIEPWTACALNESCMCLDYVKRPKIALHGCEKRNGPHDYGRCHRYDQSALGIILRKLFLEKSDHLFLQNVSDFIELKRGDKWKAIIPKKTIN